MDKSLSKYLIVQRILVDRVGEIYLHGFIFHIEATFFFLACWFSDTASFTLIKSCCAAPRLPSAANPGPSTCLVRGSGLSYFPSLAKIW